MVRDPDRVFRTKIKYEISKEKKDLIHRMMFGPFEESWRDENGIIDNSDEAVAKRLGMAVPAASYHIVTMLKEHFRRVTIERNNNPWHLPPELELPKPKFKK